MEIEHFVIVKIGPVSSERYDTWRKETNYQVSDTGRVLSGPQFRGTNTVAVIASDYGLELVCRVLNAACIPYSLEKGRAISKRKKKDVSSTSSNLKMVGLMSELQETSTSDLGDTILAVVGQPAEPPGQS